MSSINWDWANMRLSARIKVRFRARITVMEFY